MASGFESFLDFQDPFAEAMSILQGIYLGVAIGFPLLSVLVLIFFTLWLFECIARRRREKQAQNLELQ